MMTLNAIKKTILQLEAKRRSLADEMQLTANLALPLHPWQKHQGKFVPYLGYLFLVSSLACSISQKGDLNFLVVLRRVSPRSRRPVVAPILSVNICHLEGCEVLS